jgi:hypothetical protein
MSDCGLAGANLNPGTYHPEGSDIVCLPFHQHCLYFNTRLFHSHWLSVSVMSLVSRPDPSVCSDEQHNVEVQDKIDETQ